MTTILPIIDQAEDLVRQLATELTGVREGECLCCYTARQLDEYPCDGTHRHAIRFRDAAAPRATALRKRLGRLGACCCDCELFLNGYEPVGSWTPDLDEDDDEDDVSTSVDNSPPRPLLPCAGVGRGSMSPCANWVRLRHR